MIASVEIHKVRGVRQGRLEGLTALTIITGPNGSGKSTVLDALLIAGGDHLETGVALAVQRHPGTWLGVDACFARGDGSRIVVQGSDGPAVTVFVERRDGHPVPELGASPGPFRSVRIAAATLGQPHGLIRSLLFAADNACLPGDQSWAGLIEQPVVLVDPSLFRDLGQEWSEVVKAGRRKAVTELLSEVVPWASNLESLQEEGGRSQLYATGDSGAVPVNLLGDGVAALLHLAIRIAPVDQGLVLIEEPEVFQHPRSLRLSARLIVAAMRRGAQVVLTTHSVELIEMIVRDSPAEDRARMSVHNLGLEQGQLRSVRFVGDVLDYGVEQAAESLR